MPAAKVSSKPPVTNGSITALVLGILSILAGLLPLIGLGLAVAGAIIASLQIRKTAFAKGVSGFGTWKAVHPLTVAGFVISLIGVVIGAFITLFGGFMIYALTKQFS